MSTLSFPLACPGADRASLREKLEQGVYGHAFAGLLSLLLLAWLSMMPSWIGNHYGPYPPAARSAQPFVSSGALVLKVTARGEFIVDGQWIPDGQLENLVHSRLAESPGMPFAVEADKDAGFFIVRACLQRLSQLGVRRVTLVTDGSPMSVLALPWNAPRGE